jgi:hypothetical protein
MGTIFEDLEHHEGYAARRLPDGTVTSRGTPATAELRAYVAACGCGWTGTDHPPTEEGREEAVAAWEADHAHALSSHTVPRGVAEVVAEARRAVGELARRRPLAAMAVLRDLGTWANCVANIASACAREQGEHFNPPAPSRDHRRGGPAIGL